MSSSLTKSLLGQSLGLEDDVQLQIAAADLTEDNAEQIIDQSLSEVVAVQEKIEALSESVVSLEAICVSIKNAVSDGHYRLLSTRRLVCVALENEVSKFEDIYGEVNVFNPEAIMGDDPVVAEQVSLESVSEALEKTWEKLKKAMAWLWDHTFGLLFKLMGFGKNETSKADSNAKLAKHIADAITKGLNEKDGIGNEDISNQMYTKEYSSEGIGGLFIGITRSGKIVDRVGNTEWKDGVREFSQVLQAMERPILEEYENIREMIKNRDRHRTNQTNVKYKTDETVSNVVKLIYEKSPSKSFPFFIAKNLFPQFGKLAPEKIKVVLKYADLADTGVMIARLSRELDKVIRNINERLKSVEHDITVALRMTKDADASSVKYYTELNGYLTKFNADALKTLHRVMVMMKDINKSFEESLNGIGNEIGYKAA